MNADRIIVVEHGKIVEQGSHDELISANGRYADLWSKQVFVKPKDKSDETEAQIMDDLTTACRDVELAKVNSISQQSEEQDQGESGIGDDSQAKTPMTNKEVDDSAEESTTISLASSDTSL